MVKAYMTRKAAIKYFTCIPYPLIDVSKLVNGAFNIHCLHHIPLNKIVAHMGIPSIRDPNKFDHAFPFFEKFV
jgi:hypothetical protein